MKRSSNTNQPTKKARTGAEPTDRRVDDYHLKCMYLSALKKQHDNPENVGKVIRMLKELVELVEDIPEFSCWHKKALFKISHLENIGDNAFYSLDIPIGFDRTVVQPCRCALKVDLSRIFQPIPNFFIENPSPAVREWVTRYFPDDANRLPSHSNVTEKFWETIYRFVMNYGVEQLDLASNDIVNFPDNFDWSGSNLEDVLLYRNNRLETIPLSLFQGFSFSRVHFGGGDFFPNTPRERPLKVYRRQLHLCPGETQGKVVILPRDGAHQDDQRVTSLHKNFVMFAVHESNKIRGILPQPIEEALFEHLLIPIFPAQIFS